MYLLIFMIAYFVFVNIQGDYLPLMILPPGSTRSTRMKDWRPLRKAIGLSAAKMAQCLKISQGHLWELESGKTQSILSSTETVLRAFLMQPEVVLRLKIAGYPHPFPEDLQKR